MGVVASSRVNKEAFFIALKIVAEAHQSVGNLPFAHWKTITKDMNNGVMRAFFKSIPNNWLIWADGSNKLWGIWGIKLSAHILSFCVPSPWFPINQPLYNYVYIKKLKIPQSTI
jgi:hypothetical protein